MCTFLNFDVDNVFFICNTNGKLVLSISLRVMTASLMDERAQTSRRIPENVVFGIWHSREYQIVRIPNSRSRYTMGGSLPLAR